jgi:hypothetical protein
MHRRNPNLRRSIDCAARLTDDFGEHPFARAGDAVRFQPTPL